jgi:diguanylate cyclase (GGDEF)-like protein/PAS domain S-box-containing protein
MRRVLQHIFILAKRLFVPTGNLAHALVLSIICLSIWLLTVLSIDAKLIKERADYPSLINIAGKQRMLSQKVSFLSLAGHNNQGAKNQLQSSINLMLSNQAYLLTQAELVDLDGYYKKQALDTQIEDFSQFISQYSDQHSKEFSVAQTEQLMRKSDDLQVAFDKTVTQWELNGERANAELVKYRLFFGISFIIICLAIYFFILAAPLRNTIITNNLKDHAISRFKRLFDYSHEGLLILDQDWHVIHANTAAKSVSKTFSSKASMELFWHQQINAKLKSKIMSSLDKVGRWEGEVFSKEHKTTYLHVSIIRVNNEANHLDFYGAVLRNITEIKEKEEKLKTLALYDELTGLANRAHILECIENECEIAAREDTRFAVLFIDIDGFKLINDGYGHEVGDSLLNVIGHRLASITKNTDMVARLGGDEFVLLAKDIASDDVIVSLSKRMMKAFDAPIQCSDLSIQVGFSIGIASFPSDAQTASDLVKKADIAMYTAKQKGKNQFQFFNGEMELFLKERFSFEDDLRQGISNNEFFQVFQPVVDIQTGKIVGCEALLRWKSDARGSVSPNNFIPMAESLNLMTEIDKWVFKNSLDEIARLPRGFYFAINLSPKHFSDSEVLSAFLNQLQTIENKNRIIFEVTETTIINDIEQSTRVINTIRKQGFSVAIDDFGTGYTSLYNLKRLQFDIIKIDRSFINDFTTDVDSRSIVKAIIQLAKDLNLKIVAEGVETAEQRALLQQLGCEYAQGYFFAKPMKMQDLVREFSL